MLRLHILLSKITTLPCLYNKPLIEPIQNVHYKCLESLNLNTHFLFSPCPLYEQEEIVEQPVDLTTLTQRMTSMAKNFIIENVEKEQPFFLNFAFNHVHFPQFSGIQFHNSSLGGSYGDSVQEVDWAVGEIIDILKNTGYNLSKNWLKL